MYSNKHMFAVTIIEGLQNEEADKVYKRMMILDIYIYFNVIRFEFVFQFLHIMKRKTF